MPERISRLQYDHAIRDAWNALDTVALSDEELLGIADDLLPPKPDPDATTAARKRKRKWFSYLVLNALFIRFVAAKAGASPFGVTSDKMVKFHLEYLLVHDDVYRLTQEAGYEDDFAELCRNARRSACSKSVGTQCERGRPPRSG